MPKRRRRQTSRPIGRDLPISSLRSLPLEGARWDLIRQNLGLSVTRTRRSPLFDFTPWELEAPQDLREWHPDPAGSLPRTVTGQRARLVVHPPGKRASGRSRPFQAHSPVPHAIGFHAPHRVWICIRRRIRKQVLHAFGIAGSRGLRRPRRNQWSGVFC